jgi:hypothetical protein
LELLWEFLRAYDSQRFKPVVTFYFGVETENPDFVIVPINCISFKTITFFEFLKRLNSSSHFSHFVFVTGGDLSAIEDSDGFCKSVSTRSKNVNFMVHKHKIKRVFRRNINEPIIIFHQRVKGSFLLFQKSSVLVEFEGFLGKNE